MKKYVVTVNGTSYEVMVEEVNGNESTPVQQVAPQPAPLKETPAPKPEVKAAPVNSGSNGANKVNAPMPGNIVKISVKPGDSIKKGDVLLVLEAMKMENDIVSPADCVIATVNVSQGASVNSGDVLVTYN